MRPCPIPTSDTDPHTWAVLFDRARRRKGWTCDRLAIESEVGRATVFRACQSGRISAQTALKLAHALGVQLVTPLPAPLVQMAASIAEARRG